MTASFSGALFAPMARPPSTDFVEDAATGMRCHWERPVDEELCEVVLGAAVLSWETQVTQGGWPVPFPDGRRLRNSATGAHDAKV